MKSKLFRNGIIFFLLIFVVGIFLWNTMQAKSHIVLVKDGSFEPSRITLHPGEKIIFKNIGSMPHWPASDLHPTHGIYPEFDSLEGIESGKEWTFTFDKIGNWRFHDHLYPKMKGVVVVQK